MRPQKMMGDKASTAALAALGIAATLAHAEPARACSGPPRCGQVAMAPEGQVPANALGVLLDPYRDHRFMQSQFLVENGEAGQLVLSAVSEPGGALPIRVETRADGLLWVAFEQPLEVGRRYVLSATNHCTNGDVDQALTFTASEPEATPAGLGVLAQLQAGQGLIPFGDSGACSLEREVGVVDFALQSPAPLTAAKYSLLVDGQPWGWAPSYGGPYFQNPNRERSFWFSKPGVFRVWTACGFWASSGLSEGRHTVQVRAETLGMVPTELLSDPLEVTLACGGPALDEQPLAPAAGQNDEGGCNAGAGQRSNLGSLLLFAGLALLFARLSRGRGARQPAHRDRR